MELTGEQRRQIKAMVMEKYPITKGEAQCRNEREMMRRVRENYKKKLLANWHDTKAGNTTN